MPHKSSLVCTCFWVTTTTTRRVIFKHSTFISADWWNIIITFPSLDVSRYCYIDSRSKNIFVRVWMSNWWKSTHMVRKQSFYHNLLPVFAAYTNWENCITFDICIIIVTMLQRFHCIFVMPKYMTHLLLL